MADFQKAEKECLAHEGGYSNDPADKGGETFRGISRRWNTAWAGWAKIDALKAWGANPKQIEAGMKVDPETNKLVADHFHKNYWIPCKLDEVQSQELADNIYDASINSDPKDATLIAQEALQLLGCSLKQDGVMGQTTLGLLNSASRWDFLRIFKGLRFMKFYNIIKNHPEQQRFFIGWVRRIGF